MTKLFSVCIPTYNGGENLKYNINKLINISLKYNFDICVSDNASTDATEKYILDLISKYDFIKYHRNIENMGFAYNTDCALKMASTKYVWLLGDDDEIYEEYIKQLYNCLLVYKPDICVVNAKRNETKIVDLKSKLYTDKNEVMKDLGRYMSWMSCLIFNRSILDNIGINKIKDNAFPHLLGIFNFLNNRCKLYWFSYPCIDNQTILQERYSDKVLNYFVKDWFNITKRAVNYNKKVKKIFCNKLWNKLNFKTIIIWRINNAINLKKMWEIRTIFFYLPLKLRFILILSICFPIKFLKICYFIYKNN